jgi:chitin disaccharide deacetylase
MTKRLIVNADDYGHTKGASEGIRCAHLKGIVSSTTVMMNRPAALTDLEYIKQECPKLGLGLHLVITTGMPVLPASSIPSLVRQDGSFYKLDGFLGAIGRLKISEVRAEWHAQVELFGKITGHMPDHLDSHHHSSYFTPALLEEMLKLAQEVNCPVRRPFNAGEPEAHGFLPEELDAGSLGSLAALLEQYNPSQPQYFFDCFYGESATRATLMDVFYRINQSPLETFELMCHPALVDADLMEATAYNTGRGLELDILTTPGLRDELSRLGIDLITFGDL